jgi:hypothetical protein
MGFLDKAKAAANDMMTKADAALGSEESSFSGGANAKQAEPYLRDLGVLSLLEATGRAPADLQVQRDRCLQALAQLESQVALNLNLGSAAPPAPGAAQGTPPPPGGAPTPPPPGGATAPPPPGGATAPPPPPGGAPAPPPPAAPAPPQPPAGAPAPPPPPGSVAPPPPPSGA